MASSSSFTIPSFVKKEPELPPTPSSSYCPSITDPLNPSSSSSKSTTRPRPKFYGSFSLLQKPFSDDSLSLDEAPPTPPHTTINPNDDDEGLYLLWTHQLLREHGLRPASCRTNSYQDDDKYQNNGNASDDDDDDDDDEDSSQSEDEETIPSISYHQRSKLLSSASFTPPPSPPSQSLLSDPLSFLSSLPFCFCLSS
ncbi:hypothetical protein BCR42DRAFT_429383 [Absidia repens]|uniref:Uncharacterized protein n=1 Tax=Absidia repens TaxID=90262 RepID=A0A1X2HX33_9FUNG|nr:hypothetical protein BCR42DRAFT_429383 [Absidia repens]